MAKHSTKGEREKSDPYLQIKIWELRCPAYRALHPNEHRVYFEIRSRYNGRNNGRISFSSIEAGNCLHKSKSTGARAIKVLVALGFLKITRASTFHQKRYAQEFEITAIARKPATKASVLPKGTCEFTKFHNEKKIQEALLAAGLVRAKTKHSVIGERNSRADGKRSAEILKMRA